MSSERKLISAVLVTVMAAGMITGCSGKNSSIKNNVKTLEKEELKVSKLVSSRTMSLKKNMLTVTLMHTPKQMQNDRMELIHFSEVKILYFRTSAMTSSFSFWDRKEIT